MPAKNRADLLMGPAEGLNRLPISQGDNAQIAVNNEWVSGGDTLGDGGDTGDTWQAVLPCDDGAMNQHAPASLDDGGA